MPKVYFDASVIIAALLSSSGGSAKLVTCIHPGLIAGITSQTVIDEVLEHSEKMNISPGEIQDYIALSSIVVRKRVTTEEIKPYRQEVDPDDAHVVAGALLTNCAYLVTHDKKHLLKPEIQKHFKPLHILSPKELLRILT